MVITVENCKIFPPRVFCAPNDRVPLGIGYRHTELKTRTMGLPDDQRSFKISLGI